MPTLLKPAYWLGHVAMVVCVGIAVSLGLWQYDAWGQRRADAAHDLSDAAPVALGTVMTGDSPFPGRDLGRPVELTGAWMSDSTVFVADRYDGRERGYWVVTPIMVDGGESAMPVVRGWSREPRAAAPTGAADVVGWLQATEGSGPIDQDPDDDVITMMRIASLVEHVDADLYSGYVVARSVSGDAMGGLRPVTPSAIPPVSGFTALRNLLYAVEWWIFGGFALFIWLRWCRDTVTQAKDAEAAEDSLSPAT